MSIEGTPLRSERRPIGTCISGNPIISLDTCAVTRATPDEGVTSAPRCFVGLPALRMTRSRSIPMEVTRSIDVVAVHTVSITLGVDMVRYKTPSETVQEDEAL